MKYLVVASFIGALAIACGSGTTVQLQTMPRVPAAIGVADVKEGPNRNTIGKLQVEHLAPPRDLREDLNVYVAWVQPRGEREWQNIGQLMVGESRDGVLEFTVPYDRFDLMVSAERDGRARNPSEIVVMRGEVDAS